MWAQDLVPGHYRHHQADLLITLMDAWVLSPEMLTGQGMNVAHWMPVDCSPLSVLDRKVLAEGKGRPVAMSEFGRRQLEDAGHSPLFVPHGVDTAVFAPLAGPGAGAGRDGLRGPVRHRHQRGETRTRSARASPSSWRRSRRSRRRIRRRC